MSFTKQELYAVINGNVDAGKLKHFKLHFCNLFIYLNTHSALYGKLYLLVSIIYIYIYNSTLLLIFHSHQYMHDSFT